MLSDSDTEDIQTLTINEHYAKAFEYKKEREELAKLKEKYGSDFEEDEDEETDSEDAESEDEDGEELTPAVDAAILRTLARIKKKDPAIYNTENIIFEEEQERTAVRAPQVQTRKIKDKSKPLTFRQATLASALEANISRSPTPEPHIPTHTEEQRRLRDETRDAFHTAVNESDDDGLLIPREKTKDELEHEEEEYREYLKHAVGEDLEGLIEIDNSGIGAGTENSEEGAGEKKKRKTKIKGNEAKGISKQEADQEFLMNYILNRGWVDKSARRLPTYKEIVKPKSTKRKAKDSVAESEFEVSDEEQLDAVHGGQRASEHAIEDDDEFEEIADAFETSYNFRFEEPDAATIKTFPRNITSTVRRADTTRKEGRERKKQRQEEELEKKHEEVKRLKALKMKEVRRKLERIGREGGVDIDPDAEAFKEFDLDADWDPEAHDKQMAGLYRDGHDSDGEEEKPVWDDDVDIEDIIPPSQPTESSFLNKKKKKKKKKKTEDNDEGVDINAMDADVVRAYDDEEEWDGTEEMRKRKLDEYMDEVYGLEFNDMVAGMPTRFKYTTTAPQTFSLTPVELLMATDKELNQYMSVKRYAPYRVEKWDHNRGDRLKEFREKLKDRVGGIGTSHRSEDPAPKKRLGKKERQKMKAAGGGDEGAVGVEGVGDSASTKKQKKVLEEREDDVEKLEENEPPKKKRRRKHKTLVQAE
ncbi:KRI1-like family C-terminal-domain-containing protein [Suillus clintonianus]|uniref:KRI1-like family C-terminal-domain-containing protein n=1 Tax=Suillus clintonianus TaxID=1904413 RepID=UPI001B876800|nr:KRI1-like family C-terminal-domain-containing protein [Suillus clintonianus]KAG2108602.1 KRI1-like family C-terminal-domain-containing protein [Suillus clintonianus]